MMIKVLSWLLQYYLVYGQVYYPLDPAKIDGSVVRNPYSSIFYLNSCACDLILGVCEPECCCDSDCEFGADDKCSRHIRQEFNDFSYKCQVSNDHLLNDVTLVQRYFTLGSGGRSIFCLDSENLADIIKYHDEEPNWSENERVSLLLNEDEEHAMIDQFAYDIESQEDRLTLEHTSLKIIGRGGFLGNCGYPDAISSYSESFSCFIKAGQLKSSCESLDILNANLVFQNTSKFVYRQQEYDIPSSMGTIYYDSPNTYEKRETLAEPSLREGSSECTCDNVLKEIKYNFYYEDDFDFKEVVIDMTLGAISRDCDNPYETRLKIDYRFYSITQYPTVKDKTKEDSSGNPGYAYNSPLKAASFEESTIKVYNKYIPLAGFNSSSNTCSTSDTDALLVPAIRFSQHFSISCLLTSEITKDNCEDTNTTIASLGLMSALKGVFFAKVARPSMEDRENWVTPDDISSNDLRSSTVSEDKCREVISSVDIIFEYRQIDDSSGFYIHNIKREINYRDITINSSSIEPVVKLNIRFESDTPKSIDRQKSSYLGDKLSKLLFMLSNEGRWGCLIVYTVILGFY